MAKARQTVLLKEADNSQYKSGSQISKTGKI